MNDQFSAEVTIIDGSGNRSAHKEELLPHSNTHSDNNITLCSDSNKCHSELNSDGERQNDSMPKKMRTKHTSNIYIREYARLMRLHRRDIKNAMKAANSINTHELVAMQQLRRTLDLSHGWDSVKVLSEQFAHNELLRSSKAFRNLCMPCIIIPTPWHNVFSSIDKVIYDDDSRMADVSAGMFERVGNFTNFIDSMMPGINSIIETNNINAFAPNILSLTTNIDGMLMHQFYDVINNLNKVHSGAIRQVAQSIGSVCRGNIEYSAYLGIHEALRFRSPQWSDLIPHSTPRHGKGSYYDLDPTRCEIGELLEYAEKKGWSARRLSKALDQLMGNNHPGQQAIASNSSTFTKTSGQRAACQNASRDVFITDLGGTYRIRFDGDECIINKSKGLAIIKILTDHPDKFFSCFELQIYTSKGSIDRKLVGENEETARRYGLSEGYQRYQEQMDEIQEAAEHNAWGQMTELEIKHEEEVKKLLGGPRGRSVSTECARSRVAVKNAITHALKKIKPVMPKLERHLQERVQTGRHCRYLKLSK